MFDRVIFCRFSYLFYSEIEIPGEGTSNRIVKPVYVIVNGSHMLSNK